MPSPQDRPTIGGDRLLTPKEVWTALGYRSEDSFTHQRTVKPHLHPPYVKVGHRVMYWESKVKEWLK